MKGRPVHIHYHRPPARKDVYVQILVLDAPEVKVTFQPATPIPGPIEVDGRVVLEPGAPAVWFTFPGLWHDIGRFHDGGGRFTGLYANILTPCVLHDGPGEVTDVRGGSEDGPSAPLVWDTTDLFLDVWAGADGLVRLLDRDDLDAAEAAGVVTRGQAMAARSEARRILAGLETGAWPPPVVQEWTLERVRSFLQPGGRRAVGERRRPGGAVRAAGPSHRDGRRVPPTRPEAAQPPTVRGRCRAPSGWPGPPGGRR